MRLPLLVLLGFGIFLLLHVLLSTPALPEQVAVHFAGNGQPNGWMPHTLYPFFMLLMGLGMPAFIVLMFFSIRFFPDSTISLPHKEHWLNPERRSQTMGFILQQGLWLAVIELLLMLSIHHTTVIINRMENPYLPGTLAWGMLLIFLGSIIAWGIVFIRSFFLPPED